MPGPLLSKTFVYLASFILLVAGNGCRNASAPAAASVPTDEQIEAEGKAALEQVQRALSADAKVADAELALSKQRTTGGTQLELLHVQEAKTEASAEREKAKSALESLQSLETRAGDPVYASKIKEYDGYAGWLIRGMVVYEKGSSDGPSRYRRTWEDIKDAQLNWVTSSDFSSVKGF